MTTIPPQLNQRSKPQTKFRIAVSQLALVGLTILWGVSGQAAAETSDAAEDLHRRGYPNDVSLEWAVSDYNLIHEADPVARDYPKLDASEILPAISRAIAGAPGKDKKALARLTALKKFVLNGRLPRGSILTFQYDDNNRTSYWFQMGELSNKFSIFLISGMDENPPGERGGYNEKAIIVGALIRTHKRVDQEWKDLMVKMRQKRDR